MIKIVTELPTTNIDKNCIYLVANKDGEGDNVFIEYIFVEERDSFEEVGRNLTTYTKAMANLTARIEQLETKVKALEDANTPA